MNMAECIIAVFASLRPLCVNHCGSGTSKGLSSKCAEQQELLDFAGADHPQVHIEIDMGI